MEMAPDAARARKPSMKARMQVMMVIGLIELILF
jgi:hypothetical protein